MKKPAFWYKLSFRSKVFLSYFFIILILTLNLGFFCIHIIKRDANERSEKAYGDILAQMTESLSYKLSENHLSSEFIKSNTALVNALQKTDTTPWQRYVNYKSIVDPLINSISNTNPQILSVRLYHNNPVLVNHSPSIISMTQLENNGSIKRLTQENDIYYSQGDSLFFLSMLPETTRNAPEVILEICIDLHSMFSFRIESLDSYLFSVIDNKAGNLIWQQNFIPDFDPAILLTIDQSDELIKKKLMPFVIFPVIKTFIMLLL